MSTLPAVKIWIWVSVLASLAGWTLSLVGQLNLVGLVREDVVMSMPPWDVWLEGPQELAAFFLGEGSVCRDGRLIPVAVNGTGGYGNYHKVAEGVWEPWAIQTIDVAGGRIVGHHNFVYPELFPAFGLPTRLEA